MSKQPVVNIIEYNRGFGPPNPPIHTLDGLTKEPKDYVKTLYYCVKLINGVTAALDENAHDDGRPGYYARKDLHDLIEALEKMQPKEESE